MAKKNVQPVSDEVEVIAPDVQEQSTAEVTTAKSSRKAKSTKDSASNTSNAKTSKDKDSQEPKNAKDKSKDKSKSKPKKEKKSLKKKASEVISELKKVSKPSFGTVVKNTCVVIAVVAICTLLLFGMDKLFSLIYDLLLP